MVKRRSNTKFTAPQSFVSKKQQRSLFKPANHYFNSNQLEVNVRFDVVNIVGVFESIDTSNPTLDKITKTNYETVEIQMKNAEDLEKLYEAIKEKGSSKIKISIKKADKDYLFELKDKRKFDFETLKSLNKEQFIKKITV